jgi:hypothetical protein
VGRHYLGAYRDYYTPPLMVIHLRRSKINQYGEEEDKAVFYAPSAGYCPARGGAGLARRARPAGGAPFYAYESGHQPVSGAAGQCLPLRPKCE